MKIYVWFSVVLGMACANAIADPLAQLQAELLDLSQPREANYLVSVMTKQLNGKGDDQIVRRGEAGVQVYDDGENLSVVYSAALLATMASEEQARLSNKDAPTPAIDGVRELTLLPLRSAINAAEQMQRVMAEAENIAAYQDTYNDKQARRLDFRLPESRLSKGQRKYIKSFQGIYSVWVDQNGTPLASRSRVDASGRVFIFIRFHIETESKQHYQVVNGQLITASEDYFHLSHGAGERYEHSLQRTVQPMQME
ncbi:hypothetical protein QWI17_22670 [Gilvimarinus sp. SDUM040013]|uniref:Uncharacterized protein n=1 Tax=Gilvimarinus gilvus TaxID=3058038 RepID=A0ABU4S162_9GAMM|nr:hypothetical protein [Gilvimarinus sp. SDUM040013]MDO3388668.1 hypothetical protein [Gilvimarinus sp. SDUM040013]MDX6849563.1 hypothetical protein [Gilvimarinus sp. SDUM040013]